MSPMVLFASLVLMTSIIAIACQSWLLWQSLIDVRCAKADADMRAWSFIAHGRAIDAVVRIVALIVIVAFAVSPFFPLLWHDCSAEALLMIMSTLLLIQSVRAVIAVQRLQRLSRGEGHA